MAALEVIALDTSVPQLMAPQAGDTYTFPRAVEMPLGTANGVLYLNGSKVVTSGSALTFDGTNLNVGIGGAGKIQIGTASSGTFQTALYASNGVDTDFQIRFKTGITEVGTSTATPLAFALSGSEQMRLTSTGLGIGTDNPSQKLTVSGAAAFSRIGLNANAIDIVSTAQSFARFQTTGGDFYVGTESGTGGAFFPGSTAYAAMLYNANATPMQFYTAGTLRATLDSSGNLGLGVTPNTILSVKAEDNVSVLYPVVTTQSSVTTYGGMYAVRDGAGDQRGLVWQTYTANVGIGEKMRLDSSGNLGLGVTPSAWGVNTRALQMGDYAAINSDTANGAANVSMNAFFNGTNWIYRNSSWPASYYNQTNGLHRWFTAASGTAGDPISFSQAMTLDGSGNLLVGTTTALSTVANGFTVTGAAAVTALGVGHVNGSGSGTNYVVFNYNNGVIGSITQDGTTGVLYNLTSDRRLKQNIVPAPSASAVIDAIQIVSHGWKSAPNEHVTYGVIAQDLYAVAPQAVSVGDDGDEIEKTWGVDYSKLVPMLIKEIQSLRARLAAAGI